MPTGTQLDFWARFQFQIYESIWKLNLKFINTLNWFIKGSIYIMILEILTEKFLNIHMVAFVPIEQSL